MTYGRYFQKVHSKLSIRDRMQIKRTFGVTSGCIPDPKKGYRRFERWLKRPKKAIELYWPFYVCKTSYS